MKPYRTPKSSREPSLRSTAGQHGNMILKTFQAVNENRRETEHTDVLKNYYLVFQEVTPIKPNSGSTM
jgi:hypothetical protein